MSRFVVFGILAGIVAALGVLAAGPASADPATVAAEFTAGNTAEEVDGYLGMAGLGWTGPWQEVKENSVTHAIATATANPLHTDDQGDVEYLDLTASMTSTARRSDMVSRSYTAGIDITQPHSIDFKYRVNETLAGSTTFTTFDDRYQLFDSPAYNADASWGIFVYGGSHAELSADKVGKWIVYNGGGHDATPDTGFWNARNIDTGITVETGAVYDFHIDVDPTTYTWDVTIGSGGTTLYDSTAAFLDGLGWRTSAATIAGLLRFNTTGKVTDGATDTRAYSLDALRITGVASPPTGPHGGMTLVQARFTDGNTTEQVDGFVGAVGGGWKTPWTPSATGATLDARAVAPGDFLYNEIKPGQTGAYLEVDMAHAASGVNRAGVVRNYATTADPGIDWSREHTIQFTIRIDENVSDAFTFLDEDDRYVVFDSPELQTNTNSTCAWIVSAFSKYTTENGIFGSEVAGEWSFYNGNQDGAAWDKTRNVDTGIAIETGGVYDFTIVVDPDTQRYDATISHGEQSFTAEDLGWRTASATIGGYLAFAGRSNDSNDMRAFSLDDVIITQQLPPSIPGDTDGNGIVDGDDAAVLAGNWGENVGQGGSGEGDFNGDGWVNAADASILAANWGNHNGESVAGVPEPGWLVLLAPGLAAATLRRRR